MGGNKRSTVPCQRLVLPVPRGWWGEEQGCALPFFPSGEQERKLVARAGLPADVSVQSFAPSCCLPSLLTIQCSRAHLFRFPVSVLARGRANVLEF